MSILKSSAAKTSKYVFQNQLGLDGRDGKTFAVVDKFGYAYALKKFKKTKSTNKILKEVEFQRKLADVHLAPKIIDVDIKNKFIVMERMDCHLLDEINKHGLLSEKRQKELVKILQTMDKLKIFHGDANVLNYMIKNDRLYVIDFGLAKEMTSKLESTTGTSTPNLKLMILTFIIKLKESNAKKQSYAYLKKFLSAEEQQQLQV